MKTKEFGAGSIRVCVVGAVHGNERIGAKVVGLLSRERMEGLRIKTVVANEDALKKGDRFIDSDMNRIFPGKRNGDREERLAHRLSREISNSDLTIDIHSTHAEMPDTIIITKRSALSLAQKVPIRDVLIMGPIIAKGRSLIDHTKTGISLEFNRRRTTREVYAVIKKTLQNIESDSSDVTAKRVFYVYGTVPRLGIPIGIRNLKKVKRGRTILLIDGKRIKSKETFYPIFFGEPAHASLFMKAKAIRS